MHVLGAFTPNGLEQADRFDELRLGEAALAFTQGQIGSDQSGHAQGTVSAGDAQEAGMGTGGLEQRPRVQDEGRLVQQRQAGRHGNYI